LKSNKRKPKVCHKTSTTAIIIILPDLRLSCSICATFPTATPWNRDGTTPRGNPEPNPTKNAITDINGVLIAGTSIDWSANTGINHSWDAAINGIAIGRFQTEMARDGSPSTYLYGRDVEHDAQSRWSLSLTTVWSEAHRLATLSWTFYHDLHFSGNPDDPPPYVNTITLSRGTSGITTLPFPIPTPHRGRPQVFAPLWPDTLPFQRHANRTPSKLSLIFTSP
jgi:hypothetical protein